MYKMTVGFSWVVQDKWKFLQGLDEMQPSEQSKLCFILIVKTVEISLSFVFEYAHYTKVCGIIC